MKLGASARILSFSLMLLSMSLSGASADVDSGTTLRHPAPLIAVESRGDPYPGYMVLVDKQRQRLHLWEVKDGRFSEVFSVACSTGEAAGRKARSGDKKTPEGVYFFTKEHPDRDLAPIYGSRAFPIDYPNFMDRLAGRGGNSIWLHGTNKKLKPRDSNGCIVVENSAIDRLAGHITLHRTPIIIVGKLRASDGSAVQPIRQAVSAVLSGWRSALADGSYHDYLRHYDADYLPDIGWWREWTRQRGRMAAERAAVSVALENTGIYRHGPLYTVLFDQYLRSPFEAVFIGTRKLFLKEGADGFRIVGDVDQSLAEPLKGAKPGHALVAACRNLKTRDAEAEIAAVVDDWLEAWSSQDIDRYASFYARDFRSQGGADLNTWIDYKDRLNRKYRFIRVTRNKKMTIERGKRHSTVSFVQTYASNVFKTTGVKKLILKREGNRWKIYREIFNQI